MGTSSEISPVDSSDDINNSEDDCNHRLVKDIRNEETLTWEFRAGPVKDYNEHYESLRTAHARANEINVEIEPDFVLVWKNDESTQVLRETFMQRMTGEGLIFRKVTSISSDEYSFVEVFATAEALKVNVVKFQLCLPIQECSYFKTDDTQRLSVKFDKDALSACTPNHRAIIVNAIMNGFHCTDSPRLETLLADGTFYAAFQPHNLEGRSVLRRKWASRKNFHRVSPGQQLLSEVRQYFGEKIALHFAWLNYYTWFLLVASICSLICYSFGVLLDDPVTEQICNRDNAIIMCPLCDHGCSYWTLKQACQKYRFTSAMVNEATFALSLIMLVITPLYLKMWKRFSASLAHRWNISSFNVKGEPERPEYKAKECPQPVEGIKIAWKVLKAFGLVCFFILVIVVVVGGVIYQEYLKTSMSRGDEGITTLLSSLVKAVLTYCLIYGLNFVYEYIAEYITDHQNVRTQTQYDNSLTIQLVTFAFITKYAHIFFVLLVKGNFTGTPKEYIRIFNYRVTECGYGGCLLDLIILLASMKFVYTVLDITASKPLKKWIKTIYWWRSIRSRSLITTRYDERVPGDHHYINDANLQEFTTKDFLNMNLGRVLNFAIVTIFVPILPLAPIVAVIYTLYTTRTDAKELLDDHRRPIFHPARNIGVLSGFYDKIQYIAVITQGFINSFILDLVPRYVYKLFYSPNGSFDGYVEFTLSKFNTSDYAPEYLPKTAFNVSECSYRDYRNNPGTEFEYQRNSVYWHFLAARLIVFLSFVAVGLSIISLVNVCIKDTPKRLRNLVKKRNVYETYNGSYLNTT